MDKLPTLVQAIKENLDLIYFFGYFYAPMEYPKKSTCFARDCKKSEICLQLKIDWFQYIQ